MAEPVSQSSGIQWFSPQVRPRCIVNPMQRFQHGLRRQLVVGFEYAYEVTKKPDAEARLDLLGSRNKRNTRNTGEARPVTADRVGDGNQRLPHIRVAIDDFWWKRRPPDSRSRRPAPR